MKRIAIAAPAAMLILSVMVHAADRTSRTYFGRPGITGNYGPVESYQHPWSGKFLGRPFCVSSEDRYEQFLRKYQVEMARHEVAMNRLHWKD